MNRIFLIIVLALGWSLSAQGQPPLLIKGQVLESATDQPIPYSSVIAMQNDSVTSIAGTTTDMEGFFVLKVPTKDLILQVSFIGYAPLFIDSIDFQGNIAQLGVIKLESTSLLLDQAEVETEQSVMEFRLDKRVFNVGQDISSTGAGAMEVLNQVPSVNVDIEGNIMLRGNGGVQILINGKPSVLADEGSNALGTITADMIERVEVITNPSAKYEAEGSSGIINIVLKKEEKKGTNGSISVNTGIPDNHSIGISLNHRTEKFNFFTQFGAGYRSLPRFSETRNQNFENNLTISSDGVSYRNEQFFNITLGSDYYLNSRNIITLSGSFALEDEDQPSDTDFVIANGEEGIGSSYRREEETTAINPKYQYDLKYEKTFKNNKEHVLQLSTLGSFFGKDLNSEFFNISLSGEQLDPDQQTETSFFQQDFIYQLDYTNPFNEFWTIETGGLYEVNDVGNEFTVRNETEEGTFEVDSSFTNSFDFDQRVLGVYSTISFENNKWGIKLGGRLENTNLETLLKTTDQRNNQNYTNFFPSVHSSYKFNDQFSLQAGYSRRIFRPRLWDLNPFFNVRNIYNIRQGNPELGPEYADSYELTSIYSFDKASINTSIYHLHTTDIVERVTRFVDDVSIVQPENIGTKDQTGLEINGKYQPNKWWTMNGDFNYGWFSRNGQFQAQDLSFNGTVWYVKMTHRFRVKKGLDLESTINYNSPVVTLQGEVSGFASADVGIRKKLWKGKGVINLSVRDVFASRIRESFAQQEDFFLYSFSQRGRFIRLGFSYSFGKGEAMSYTGRRR